LLVILLGLLGFVSFPFLSRTRPIAYTIILILTAVIAPTPDPIAFVALAVPIVALYEACIWVVWFIDRRRAETNASGGPALLLLLVARAAARRLDPWSKDLSC
jgi:Sec-independent protein secretion pathway component TatC